MGSLFDISQQLGVKWACYSDPILVPGEALNITMTVEDFCELHEIEQEELVFNKGVFLGNYVEDDVISDVYQLFNFYVTFSYMLSSNERAIIKAFNNPGQLPMLDDIDISGLI